MADRNLLNNFEKCADYSVLTGVIMGAVTSMNRFKRVSRERILTSVYTKLKNRAAKVK